MSRTCRQLSYITEYIIFVVSKHTSDNLAPLHRNFNSRRSLMSFFRNILFASGTLSVSSLGYFGYWTQQNSREVPADQKGNLIIRMQEITLAFYQVKQIKDKYTAEKHIASVTNLSSKNAPIGDKLKKEMDKIATSYYAGYIQEALQENPSMTMPVFDYSDHLPVLLPTPAGETHKGFIFSGPLYNLHSLKSRQDILNGNYIRCKSQMTIKTNEKYYDRYQPIDVLITGTTDCTKCNQLKNAILRDAAMIASDISWNKKINAEDPISDTPVMDCNETGCGEVGDLTSIPEPVKEKIRNGNFTACNFYALNKTRLSQGSYKECGAIIVGTTDESACQDLHFSHMRKIIEQVKQQNKQ